MQCIVAVSLDRPLCFGEGSAKGEDKGRLSREQEDGFLLLPLVGVVQEKAEAAYVEEEE